MDAKFIIVSQTCTLTKDELSQLVVDYDIPRNIRVILPKRTQTIFDAPLGYVRLYTHSFTLFNLKNPLLEFFCEVLNYFKVHISRFNPFGLAKLTTFYVMCKAYGCEPSVDLLRAFLNLVLQMNFRSFMMKGIDGEFHFEPEGGVGDSKGNDSPLEKDVADEAKNRKVGKSSKANGKRKQVAESPRRETYQKDKKASPQASKASSDPSDPLNVDSDPDIHAYMRQVVLDNMLNSRTRKLMSTMTKARASCDAIRKRKREKEKAYAELQTRFNVALQNLDKNPLVLDMHAEIGTLQGQVDRLHGEYSRLIFEEKKWVNYEQTLAILRSKVKGLESERERLKKSKTQLLQEVHGLRQDRVVVVAKFVPNVATKYVHSDEMGLLIPHLAKAALFHGRFSAFKEAAALKEPFELEKILGYRPFSKKEFDQAGDNLATTFILSYRNSMLIIRPFGSVTLVNFQEVLLPKKLKSLCVKPSPSSSKPSSSKTPNPGSSRSPCRRYFDPSGWKRIRLKRDKSEQKRTKPDKNGKHVEAGKSLKQLQWIKEEKLKKTQKEWSKMHTRSKSYSSLKKRRKDKGLNIVFSMLLVRVVQGPDPDPPSSCLFLGLNLGLPSFFGRLLKLMGMHGIARVFSGGGGYKEPNGIVW
nr:hypothetical protein [Tanacetum cinerariifolium]